MNICTDCGHAFSDDEMETGKAFVGYMGSAPAYESYGKCPFCGSDDIEEAYECESCGEYFADGEIGRYSGVYICAECKKELVRQYNDFQAFCEEHYKASFADKERELLEALREEGEIE